MNINDTPQNEADPSAVVTMSPFINSKIDYISTVTKKTNDIPKVQKQRVRFHKVECTYQTIEDNDDPTATLMDEHDDEEGTCQASHLWYRTEDFKKFRSDDKKLMRVYRNLIKRKQRIPAGTIDADNMSFINEEIEKLEDEIRGLEDYKSIRANIDFKHRRHACCYAVMKEQARQRKLFLFQKKRMRIDDDSTDDSAWKISTNTFELDVTSIRNSVLDTSMKSKLLAFTLGLSDASYIRQMKTVDDGSESIVENMAVEGDVDENKYKRCIVEADEQRICIKVPPRFNDVDDMTSSPVSRYRTVSPVSATKATASSILRSIQLRHLIVQTPYVSCA